VFPESSLAVASRIWFFQLGRPFTGGPVDVSEPTEKWGEMIRVHVIVARNAKMVVCGNIEANHLGIVGTY
jgi:hypothetical protein